METSDKIDEKISGNVIITDDQIIWTRNDKIISKIPLDKIKLIGEYTTSGGPVNDDWFVVFMTSKDTWLQIPVYAKGIPEVLSYLCKYFNTDLTLALQSSAEWKTRIVWPEKLIGKQLWNIIETPPKTFKEKLNSFLFFIDPTVLVLTEHAELAFKQ